MKDKNILVTGGSSGIGQAIVIGLARHGYKVFFTYRSKKNYWRTKEILQSMQLECNGLPCNIADIGKSRKTVASLMEEAGTIDGLVNCAGISNTKSIEDIDEDEWDKMLDTNLKGTFFLTKEVFLRMKTQGYGRIVTVTSIAGQRGGFFSGVHYCASKAGLEAMVKCFALYGAEHGISYNAVSPGVVDTPMAREEEITCEGIPMGRTATPEEIAAAVEFLLSNGAGYITGATIDVNGGQLMR